MNYRGRNDWRTLLGEDAAGVRLADYLSRACLLARQEALDLIDFGSVHLDGRQHRDPSTQLEAGRELRIFWPWRGVRRFYEIDGARILYRDRYLLAYNKEAGVPSQQTPSDGYNNVFMALKRFLKTPAGPGYVALHHRLDLETSGVMIFSVHRQANRNLGAQFQERHLVKDYLAWVEGSPVESRGLIDQDIGRERGTYCVCPNGTGKPAQTAYWVLRREPETALVWARPLTGRTHQIRLHLAALGHPVVGDRRYGSSRRGPLLLHAYRLRLPHPVIRVPLELIAPLDPRWANPPPA